MGGRKLVEEIEDRIWRRKRGVIFFFLRGMVWWKRNGIEIGGEYVVEKEEESGGV